MFPEAHIMFDDHVSHHASIGSCAKRSRHKNDKLLPLTLRFASVGGKTNSPTHVDWQRSRRAR
jgi:hypothetical protein